MNRELDIAIALLLGWRWVDDGGIRHLRWHDAPGFAAMEAGGEVYPTSLLLRYSGDISAAWMVVEYFRSQWDEGDLTDRFWSFKDCGISCGGWRVEIEVCPDHDGCAAIYEATAPTFAEALCRAALRAVGGREEEP